MDALWADSKLKTPHLRLANLIIEKVSWSEGLTWYARSHFAEVLGCCTKSIRRYIAVLERQGHIALVCKRGRGRPAAAEVWKIAVPHLVLGDSLFTSVDSSFTSGDNFRGQSVQVRGQNCPPFQLDDEEEEREGVAPIFLNEIFEKKALAISKLAAKRGFDRDDALTCMTEAIGSVVDSVATDEVLEALDQVMAAIVDAPKIRAFASFASSKFRSELRRVAIDRASHRADLDLAPERAAAAHQGSLEALKAKTQAEVAVQAKRPEFAESAFVAKHGRSALQPDPNRFTEADGKIGEVNHRWVKHVLANEILDAVPGATREDLQKVLIDISDQRLQSDKAIKERATTTLETRIAYRQFGTPEDQCRGKPARISVLDANGWLRFSREFLEEMSTRYPHAMERGLNDPGVYDALSDAAVVAAGNKSQYGRGLQALCEQHFADALERLEVERARQAQPRDTGPTTPVLDDLPAIYKAMNENPLDLDTLSPSRYRIHEVAQRAPEPEPVPAPFLEGTRVRHPQHGLGTVTAIESENARTVRFDDGYRRPGILVKRLTPEGNSTDAAA